MGACCSCGRRRRNVAYDGVEKKRMNNKEFNEAMLNAHNKYRSMHGVSKLTTSSELNDIAQGHANSMAKSGIFAHSRNRSFKGKPLGENIASQWSSNKLDYAGDQATKQWYDEVNQYVYNKETSAGTGHFTQVVWKESKQIGIGRSRTSDGHWYVVANYTPAGNFKGEHSKNVFPPSSK